jgi:spermidine synthase
MIKAAAKTREIFEISQVYMFYIGIYPSSLWSFGFSSKGLDPVRDMQPERFNALNLETHYYNTDLHPGAFMIPTYVKNLLRD